MNKKILKMALILKLSFLLAIVPLLISCGSEQPVMEELAEMPGQISEAVETAADEIGEKTNEIIDEIKEETATEHTPEVAELIAESDDISSYHYSFRSMVRDNVGNFKETASYQAFIKGDKIKKTFISPKEFDNEFYYNQVYLDAQKRVAYAVCEGSGVLCEGFYNKARKISYNTEKISATPLDLIQSIPADAAKVEEETIENRKAAIIAYKNSQGQYEKLSIDTYSGIPLKQIIYTLEDDEEVILEKNTFSLDGINSVKNSDVTLPDRYEITE